MSKRDFHVEPWLVYSVDQVKKQLIQQPARFCNEIEYLRKMVAESIEYPWSNNHHHMWSPRHKEILEFSVYNDKDGVGFHVWNTDSMNLGSIYNNGDPDYEWKTKVNDFFKRLALVDEGKLHCSDCQEIILLKERGGRYFGGVYCQSCWDGTWKAIEAKETYN